MPFFDGRTGQVHFRRWSVPGGASPALSLVFLHGMGQHSGHYHRFAGSLTGAGIEVWAIDHTGHGLSEGEPGVGASLSDLAADAASLSDIARIALPGVPQAVMGHSLGALTALTILAHRDHHFVSAVLCGTPRSAVDQDGWAGLDDVQIPILVVHGADDRMAPVDPVRSWVSGHSNVEMREFEDAGHDLLHEKVHASVSAVSREFLLAHGR